MNVKSILGGVLIGIVALSMVTLGGSFTLSLIQGHSVDKSLTILATQIDSLIGRVEMIETKQAELQSIIGQNETSTIINDFIPPSVEKEARERLKSKPSIPVRTIATTTDN
jgi:hypothetical protein